MTLRITNLYLHNSVIDAICLITQSMMLCSMVTKVPVETRGEVRGILVKDLREMAQNSL